MKSLSLIFLLCNLFCRCSSVFDGNINSTEYRDLEQSLLDNKDNMEKLQRAFYPTNHQTSLVVDITYHFMYNNEKERVIHKQQEGEASDLYQLESHRILRSAVKDDSNADTSKYRWMMSSMNLYCNPELLSALSLYTYKSEPQKVDLTVNMSPEELLHGKGSQICGLNKITEDMELLNELTSNMMIYVTYGKGIMKAGVQSSQAKGFSAYFFNNSSNYCVLGQEDNYKTLNILLITASLLLVLVFTLGSPVMFTAIYDNLKKKMKEHENLKYFVWGTGIIAFLVVLLILGYVHVYYFVYAVLIGEHHFTDENKYIGVCYGVLLSIVIIGDIVAFVIVGCVFKSHDVENFPIPMILTCYNCYIICKSKNKANSLEDSDDDQGGPLCCCLEKGAYSESHSKTALRFKILVQISVLGCSFTMFLQLIAFHSVFVIMGSIASPVAGVSHTMFHVAVIFCLVAFTALLLKFTDNSLCNAKNTDASLESATKVKKTSWIKNLSMKLSLMGSALMLLISIALFVAFEYLFSTMVPGYPNPGDALIILGHTLPSIFASLAGFLGVRLIGCLKGSNKPIDPSNNQTDISKPDETKNVKKGAFIADLEDDDVAESNVTNVEIHQET